LNDIYVIGYPKTGTTWIARLLGDVLNSPVGSAYRPATNKCIASEGADRPGPYYIGQSHATPVYLGKDEPVWQDDHLVINIDALTDEKIVIVERDPRDVVVSARHHWDIESLDKALDCMMFAEWPIPHGGGWHMWYAAWEGVPDHERVIRVSYDRLLARTGIELFALLVKLGVSASYDEVAASVARQSFDARKLWTIREGDNLNYGKDFQVRFLRKGQSGDWKNHLKPSHLRRMDSIFRKWYYESP
jgi:hypothetical protein